MARSTLEDWEVALIKAMIFRDLPNKTIQFYFNTPSRAVNSGRISEIKSGDRWAEIVPASQFELDDFIDRHPMQAEFGIPGEPEAPHQLPAASVFTVTDDEQVDLIPDPIDAHGELAGELNSLHQELQHKTTAMIALGHNFLGATAAPIDQFNEAIQGALEETSVTRIWSRGNKLRAIMNAHDAVAGSDDLHPSRLDAGCAEMLRDLVEAFNILIATDPKAAELDRRRLGPDEREKLQGSADALREVIADAARVATEDALGALSEQVEDIDAAPETSDGDRQVALAQGSSQNFFQTMILGAYRRMRAFASDQIAAAWADYRAGVVGTVSASVIAYGGQLLDFVLRHIPAIRTFLEATAANPTVQKILEFLASIV